MSTLSTTNLKNPSSGSNNIVLNTDGTTTITSPSNIIKSGTEVASTSGTAIDFTGIPSWVKKITVMFQGVSTSGTSNMLLQLGSGSFLTSGYLGSIINQSASQQAVFSSGFVINTGQAASDVYYGNASLNLFSSTIWSENSIVTRADTAALRYGAGFVSLSGTLDRVRITTSNGTDTFDAGTINILYEG